MNFVLKLFIFFLPVLLLIQPSESSSQSRPKVLMVTAHPDDDAVFAGTNYKIVNDLKGIVDLALITNGEGGYKYSTLAENIYGLELTNEDTGRKYLPQIRKNELEAGGKIIGIRNYFYFDQKDHRYVTSEFISEILDSNIWDLDYIRSKLKDIITKENYDFVFIMTPSKGTHAHHSASAILTLEAIQSIEENERPVVLAGSSSSKNDTVNFIYRGLKDFPLTNVSDTIPFQFDRTQKFGYRDVLDYKIIVNWLIAEHKSQGTMQLLMNRGDIENYWYLDINDESGKAKAKELFDRLKINYYPKKEYN
ncbi:MAG TPA: PIG-L family deacetylase [Ignavibacteria bacterium]|nr:PIG-L family deacetylase [Bacteroidota bacterium]HRI85496.1 PIG-L family deacetylase [Ignavibacteria bacterium]HRJ99282.1 PIG-L family deacetylase [Ignavibacteria bacterium]